MTRRGSLAYYLAAWVCGCLFMSLGMWIAGEHAQSFDGASGFLFLYFLSLIFGAFTTLLFAFVLRRMTSVLRYQHLWQWLLLGAVLGGGLVRGLGWLRPVLERAHQPAVRAAVSLVGVVAALPPSAFWVAIPAGAATAFVLYQIHRAFSLREEPVTPDRL